MRQFEISELARDPIKDMRLGFLTEKIGPRGAQMRFLIWLGGQSRIHSRKTTKDFCDESCASSRIVPGKAGFNPTLCALTGKTRGTMRFNRGATWLPILRRKAPRITIEMESRPWFSMAAILQDSCQIAGLCAEILRSLKTNEMAREGEAGARAAGDADESR